MLNVIKIVMINRVGYKRNLKYVVLIQGQDIKQIGKKYYSWGFFLYYIVYIVLVKYDYLKDSLSVCRDYSFSRSNWKKL